MVEALAEDGDGEVRERRVLHRLVWQRRGLGPLLRKGGWVLDPSPPLCPMHKIWGGGRLPLLFLLENSPLRAFLYMPDPPDPAAAGPTPATPGAAPFLPISCVSNIFFPGKSSRTNPFKHQRLKKNSQPPEITSQVENTFIHICKQHAFRRCVNDVSNLIRDDKYPR